MKKMLIADDNKQITMVIEQYAMAEGFKVDVAYDGAAALKLFTDNSYDIVLLDVMMPVLDGFRLCHKIRETSSVPIIMITAKGEDFDKIMGLDMGADDYIVKPFSPKELMARVRAILRRIQKSTTINYPNLEINIDDYIVKVSGEIVALTKKEIEILYTLASNKGKVFSRDNLLDTVWGIDYYGDTRTVDSHIKRLRAKLNVESNHGFDIVTIWGVGYKFEVTNE